MAKRGMQLDAREVREGTIVETDVAIVGAGTAGVTLARELAGERFRVCLLESGGRSPDPETQSLAFGEIVGYPYYALDTARARYLGGSSTRWHVPAGGDYLGARLRPFDAIDFETREWVAHSGWPFSKTQLDPYYERAQHLCQVQPCTFEVEDWADQRSRPHLPLADGRVQTIIYKIGRRDPFVHDCIQELEKAANVAIYLYANVLEVLAAPTGDRVSELRVRTLPGSEFRVRAKVFVMASGGIEVPRLLLLSDGVHKSGLGNTYDLVGRFFMEHPHFWSGMIVPAKHISGNKLALYDIHTVNGVAILGKFALTEETLRRERLLNQNVQLIVQMRRDPFRYPRPRLPAVQSCRELLTGLRGGKVGRLGAHLRTVLSGIDDVVVAATRKVHDELLGVPEIPVYIFANMMEQVPNPESRVMLGSTCDLFGQRRVQLDWRITPQDVRSAIRTQEIIGPALEQAGLGRFYQELSGEAPPPNTEGGYHHMGTTRMHVDPKQGVVDADCRVHGVENLFIAGPSVFPTGGYANPVLTMVALTIRLGDRIKRVMA